MIKIRKSQERGYFDHGWLKSFHSFSFANYFDPNHMNFGNLRVINEDFIAAGEGFGEHPHRDMEIITYVISGALSHKDSMGNSSAIFPGEVQVMSAGRGVFHSEFNHEKNQETHLLQIWILPDEKDLEQSYHQKSFFIEGEKGFKLVVSKDGRQGSLPINQKAEIFVGKFDAGYEFKNSIKNGRKAWLQIVKGEILLNDKLLSNGDAAFFEDEKEVIFLVKKDSEFLFFDL